ncbi:molybdopterin-dependent oxidoreductase [Aquimarina sp. 2201CG5-10]|uniref:molybdopterin-dependent oxidoreductase n=1 Tax=Aquimarina callyspongiae TaxID=3098150 RepID=UPI002AB3CD91|nr:molybdopterin-dependent oxidoreductase [Aquimarina sp. 2201CG5-10]MDY8138168.1 molybdopterin-dependent oxidoreductase [Aquimarina sp. 2201CG5-10]
MPVFKSYKTTCSYCGVGCGIIAKKDPKGIITVEGDSDHPVNRGMLCSKGMNLHHVIQDKSDRILYPEMRWSKLHKRQRVSWDQAMDRATAVFNTMIKKYGPDSVGFYVSGQCLTEEYYLVNKLAKGFIGTNNIDTNSRLCMSSAVVGYKQALGEDSVPISYDDIELADCFMIAGANPAWCHPILYRRVEAHKEKNPNVKIIVIDPRKTQSCDIADLHLQIIPGTDVVLLNAIARRLVDKKKIDKTFISNHTDNYEALKESLNKTSLTDASKICGVSVKEIKKAASYISNAKGFMTLWAMGLNQSSIGVNKNNALLNLSLLTGHIGKPGSGPFSLTGQPNAMGGREVGGMANLLAAHRDLTNERHRSEVTNFWRGKEISGKPGLTATEMFDALETGKLKAIWIVCTNPLVSLPNSHKVEKALKNAKFVIVQDISHRSESLEHADLVLPAAGWGEKEGTMTNSERRITYLSKFIDPPGEAIPDAEIFWKFAQRMRYKGFDYNSAEEVYKEHCRLTKDTNIDISGLSYQRLKEEKSFQWPVPHNNHPGTSHLFRDKKFYTNTGNAKFVVPRFIKPTSELLNEKYPLILTTGRVRDQWHTRTKTGKVNRLLTHIPDPYLEINQVDAFLRRLKDGDIAIVESKRGKVRVRIKISDTIKKGVVFLPIHWGKVLGNDYARANNLTTSIIDPISKEPDFKFSAIQVSRFVKEKQKICIIGAGTAAYRFIQTYREHNTEDEIIVFSKERYPFYNRVLLPEYVSKELKWAQLQKMREGSMESLNVTLSVNNPIKEINKEGKYIIDSNGEKHQYDVVLMATGSRAFVPKEIPIHLPGRFTMRDRGDADKLKRYLKQTGLPEKEQHVTIVGGGLLGLELAAALRKKGVNITIVQRGNRLMERQLDIIASRLLAEDVQEKGIQIHFDNEVDTVFNQKSGLLLVNLKSGKSFTCNAVVYSIGTIPNIDLVKTAGVDCRRGILVNQYLQSSDPSIFAVGEIAEFQGNLYGITAAAEQQADIVAKYLLGDFSAIYKGSVFMNILKFENLDLCSIGNIDIPQNDSSYEEVVFMDVGKRFYKKCIVKNDWLVGAILMGDKSEFADFKRLIEEKIELSEKREELLRSSQSDRPIVGKLICSCSQVGEGNLEEEIKSGCGDFSELCHKTGAGLGCGSCKPEVKEVLNKMMQLV